MLFRSLAVLLFVGCGFRASSAPGDANAIDASDAPLDTPGDTAPTSCVSRWLTPATLALSQPVELAAVNRTGTSERDPYLTTDQLTLYLSSNRLGANDIFRATRLSPADPFGTPALETGFSSLGDDEKLSMTADGTIAVIASDRLDAGAQGQLDVWYATGSGGTFGGFTQAHMSQVNDNTAQFDPELSADGLDLYLAPFVGGAQKISLATRGSSSADFSAPAVLTNINSGSGDADPTVSGDELVIVFSSQRGGGTGGVDLWFATRTAKDLPFGPPFHVPTVNSTGDDGDPMLSRDACHLIFSRGIGGGDYDLYAADVMP